MAEEAQNENSGQQNEPSVISQILGQGYLGGELDAAFRQGARELGAALKAFPDAIQVDEPGQVFNPLYRDRDGDTPARTSSPSEIADQGQDRGSVYGNNDSMAMSPSEIADQSASRGSVYGDAQANTQSPSEIADSQPQISAEQEQSRSRGRGM